MSKLEVATSFGEITIVHELTYSFRSTDNVISYPRETIKPDGGAIQTCYGLVMNGSPQVLVAVGGGATSLHAHSVVVVGNRLYVAIGNHVVAMSLPGLETLWATKVDWATCFGIHVDETRGILISHGELAIARLSEDGQIPWTSSGRDIFTGQFALRPEWIEARDWNDQLYRFEYETGASL